MRTAIRRYVAWTLFTLATVNILGAALRFSLMEPLSVWNEIANWLLMGLALTLWWRWK